MDTIFWQQVLRQPRTPCSRRVQDSATRRFAEINYGPWDRLDGNAPFVAGVGPSARRAPSSIRTT